MSIRGLNASNYYTATVDLDPGSRSLLVSAGRIPVFASMNSFNPAWGADNNGSGAAPLHQFYGDNGPNLGSINDDTSGTAGVSLSGLENVWFGMSTSADGLHNGSFQTLRTGVNNSTNTGSRGTTNTSNHFIKIKFGTTPLGGNWNGDLVNCAIFTGMSDAQEDQLRAWATQYWFDTVPSPYSTGLLWSRRFSTNLTTGFGSGDPVATGSPTNNATGDPSITSYSSGSTGGNLIVVCA